MDESAPKAKTSPIAIAVIITVGVAFMGYASIQYQKLSNPQPGYSPSPSYPNQIAYADRSTINPEVLRGMLATEYLEVMKDLNPNYNYMETKIVKGKGGFTLYAIHPFFNRYEFDYGRSAGVVSRWIESHSSELKHAGIVGVGVKSKGPYADYVAYKVK